MKKTVSQNFLIYILEKANIEMLYSGYSIVFCIGNFFGKS